MSIQVGLGISTSKDHIQALKEAAAAARIKLKGRVNLAIVFSSPEYAHPTVYKTIKSLISPEAIIGASGPAIISDRGVFKHAIAIMLLGLPDYIYYNAACVKELDRKSPADAGSELAEKLLYGFKNLRRDLAIILSSTSPSSASGLIQGLQERLGNSFPFIGASSPDKSALQKASVVFDETICAEAACGILLGGKLRFSLGVGQGWKPLGKIHRITKSHGNVAFEIDDKPAAKMYEEYFGRTILALRKDLQDISTLYPLGVYLEGRKEYLLRNIIFIESDGSMVLRGDVPEGSGIRLMIGTKESCLKAAKEAAEQVKRGLTGQPPTFALVFSSASRYTLLGRDIYKELGAIQEEVGPDTPLLGLYTYGEIAPLRAINYLGKTYFHNQSINILAIGS